MAYRVFISASTQDENIGVGAYGTEQDRMMFMGDRVKYYLDTQRGQFIVIRNEKNWTLQQTVNYCNNMACDLFIDNHTNSGPTIADGTEVFYHGSAGIKSNSYKIAKLLYDKVAPISPGKDRGIKPDNSLHKSGLYVIQKTIPPACLIEHIFHSNTAEVEHIINNVDLYAKAEAMAICEYFNIDWYEPVRPSSGGIHIKINGIDINSKLDVEPALINGRVLVPVRFVAEALGAEVSWDDATKTVNINRKEGETNE